MFKIQRRKFNALLSILVGLAALILPANFSSANPSLAFDIRTSTLSNSPTVNGFPQVVGTPIVLSGYLDLNNDTSTVGANTQITPTIRASVVGAQTITLSTVTSDANGYFTISITPPASGYYSVTLSAANTTSTTYQFSYYPNYANFSVTFSNSAPYNSQPLTGYQGSTETVTVTVFNGAINGSILPSETVTVQGTTALTNSFGVAQFTITPLINTETITVSTATSPALSVAGTHTDQQVTVYAQYADPSVTVPSYPAPTASNEVPASVFPAGSVRAAAYQSILDRYNSMPVRNGDFYFVVDPGISSNIEGEFIKQVNAGMRFWGSTLLPSTTHVEIFGDTAQSQNLACELYYSVYFYPSCSTATRSSIQPPFEMLPSVYTSDGSLRIAGGGGATSSGEGLASYLLNHPGLTTVTDQVKFVPNHEIYNAAAQVNGFVGPFTFTDGVSNYFGGAVANISDSGILDSTLAATPSNTWFASVPTGDFIETEINATPASDPNNQNAYNQYLNQEYWVGAMSTEFLIAADGITQYLAWESARSASHDLSKASLISTFNSVYNSATVPFTWSTFKSAAEQYMVDSYNAVSHTLDYYLGSSTPAPTPSSTPAPVVSAPVVSAPALAPIAPAPVTPAPTPEPSQTPAPVTPAPSATQEPTPTPTPSQIPAQVPTPTPTPVPTSSPSAKVGNPPTLSGLVIGGSGAPKVVVGIPANATTALTQTKVGFPISIVLPSVPKGTKVLTVIKGPNGQSFSTPSATAAGTGSYKLPNLGFSKPGSYTVTVTIGKTKKVITITVH